MENGCVDLTVSITIGLILMYYTPEYQCITKPDISDLTLIALISQKGRINKLYQIGYSFCKFSSTELIYEIKNKFIRKHRFCYDLVEIF
jgi:hypothetical protein